MRGSAHKVRTCILYRIPRYFGPVGSTLELVCSKRSQSSVVVKRISFLLPHFLFLSHTLYYRYISTIFAMSFVATRCFLASPVARSVTKRSFIAASNVAGVVRNNNRLAFGQAIAATNSTMQPSSAFSTMDSMESGTKMYMSLYPEGSTDGSVRLGNIVPDFSAETTHGKWDSFHEWKKGKWAILFSHPADFTREFLLLTSVLTKHNLVNCIS